MLTAPACSSFGESSTSETGDAAPVPEAGPREAGTGLEDADAGPLPGCLPPLCESFETDAWAVLWPPTGGARIGVSTGPSSTGTRALELKLGSGDDPAYVERALGNVRKVTASVNVLVVKRGAGEVDFFEIVEGQSGTDRGVHFVHSASGSRFASDSSASVTQEILPTVEQSFAKYTRVEMVLDVAARTYAMTVGAHQTSGQVDPAWNPKQLYVAIGAAYVANVPTAESWIVRFDDVSVVTEP